MSATAPSPDSLAARLTVGYAATFLALLGASFVALYVAVGAVLDARIDEDLEEDARELALALAERGLEGLLEEIGRETAGENAEDVLLAVVRADGRVVHASDASAWARPGVDPDELARAVAGAEPAPVTRPMGPGGREARRVLAPLGDGLHLLVAESLEEREELMALMRAAFALTFLVAMPAASLLVWRLARRSAADIERVGAVAAEIAEGALDRRVGAIGRCRETRELAASFDRMAERNQKLLADMREMTDNVAHDLRSPLARVRILAERARGRGGGEAGAAARDIAAECDRLAALIDASLDVSEAEAGVVRGTSEAVDPTDLAAGLVELFEPLADERRLALAFVPGPTPSVLVERQSIERGVANLLDNALKFAAARVRVATGTEGDRATIDVEDDGPGLDAALAARAFDRYFRADPSRGGSGCGLGLSYARAVARLHGGDVELRSEPGVATRFRLWLPGRVPHRSVTVR